MRLACLLLLVACAPQRPVVDAGTLLEQRAEFYRGIAIDAADAARVLEERMLWHARERPDEHVDILVLSGGGAKGAFGAGFLQGWDRPDFDVVTGVSTGAMLAPFAFVGTDEMLDTIVNLYRNPKKDWVVSRKMTALFRKTSFFDASGLHRDVREIVNEDLLGKIAERHKDSRLLLIGTTDLDLGVLRTWNVTRLAEQGNLEKTQDVLLASAAIPAAFPPIEIDGHLYVDGGVAAQFVGIDAAWVRNIHRKWGIDHPGLKLPPVRFWIIINNKISVTPESVPPTWPSVAGRSIDVLMRQSVETLLFSYIASAGEVEADLGIRCEVRYVTIPDSHPEPDGKDFFDAEVMERLIELGRRMGADPSSWQTEIANPDWPHPRPTPLESATSARAEASPPR